MQRFFKLGIITLLLMPTLAFATPTTVDYNGSVIQPLIAQQAAPIKADSFTATDTAATSTFYKTNIMGAGVSILGEYFTNFTNYVRSLFSAGTGLTYSAGQFSITSTGVTANSYTNANITVNAQGQITAASNGSAGGVTSIATTYPLQETGSTGAVTLSTAFGTTTNNGIGNNVFLYNSNSGIMQGAASSSLDLPNTALQHSSITVNTVAVSLGSSITVASTTLLGDTNIFSGTDTFNNTITGSVSGNAGTATKLATGRTISITGDLAYTSPTFDGSGNVTAAGTLATVNTNVGTFTYPSVTVNGKGLITAISNGSAPTTYTGTYPIQVSGSTISSAFSTTTTWGAGNNGLVMTGATGIPFVQATSSAINLNITGLAGTATALAANGTNCSAGSYPLGVDASGNVEGCTVANLGTVTAVNGTANQITSSGGTTPTLSLPNHVIFPNDFLAILSSTTNATTTGSAYFTGITASRPLYVDSTGKLTSAGSGTSGNCVDWGANNTLADAGAACGTSSGGITTLGNYASTTGASISLSTSTLSFNGLTLGQTIVVSANGIMFTPTVTGTLNNAGLTNSSFTVNGQLFNLGDTHTITAASSSLLGDTNTFSGTDKFNNAITVATLGGFIGGNSGTLYNFATSTIKTSQLTNDANFISSNQTITLSGDVSGSGATAITTAIGANKVTLGDIAQVGANTLLGNNTGATGNVSAISTSSLGLTTSAFASPNISQWTNNSGYLTAAITTIGPTGQTQTGATQTLATSSATTISGLKVGLTITASGNTQTFTPNFTGSISGLTTSNFTSANISQWTNDAGYDTFGYPFPANATTSSLTLGGLTITGAATGCATFTSGVISSTGSACGGAGSTPGGASNSIQFNNASSFGGVNDFFYNTAGTLGIGTSTPNANTLFTVVASSTGQQFSTIFAIASSTSGTATTTLFSVSPPTASSDLLDVLTSGNTNVFAISNIGSTTLGDFGTCGGSNALTTNSGGTIICGAISGGGGGSGTVGTSTHEIAGELSYWTSNSATPALLGGVATSSVTCTGFLTCAAGDSVIGASALTITTTGVLGIASGGTNNSSFTTNGIVFYDGSELNTNSTPIFAWKNSAAELLVGTSTEAEPSALTIASSTAPELLLGDGIKGDNLFAVNSISGNLYIGTSSPTTNASSTNSWISMLTASGFSTTTFSSTDFTVKNTSSNAFNVLDRFGTQDATFGTASTTGSIFTVAATTSPNLFAGIVKLFDVDQYGHLTASSTGAAPTLGTCTGGATFGANSNDVTGDVTLTTAVTSCAIIFAHPYPTIPEVFVTGAGTVSFPAVTARSTTGFTIGVGAAVTGDDISYIVIQP